MLWCGCQDEGIMLSMICFFLGPPVDIRFGVTITFLCAIQLLTDSFSLGDVFPAETTSVLINSSFVDRTTSTNTAISGMTP